MMSPPKGSNSDSELPSGELILDDEDIVINKEEGIEIKDEDIIPEEKVIANDRDQTDDLFNEIMKNVPERYRNNRTFIKKTQTIVKSCVILKEQYSTNSTDIHNIFKLNLKLKEPKNKPLLEKLLKYDFDETNILPIVDDTKELYDILDDNYADLLNANLSEIDNESFITTDNTKKILDAIRLRESYRKGKQRLNYSYSEEMERLHNMNMPYKMIDTNGNHKAISKDQRVFRNTFSKEKISYNKLKLEPAQLEQHTVLKEDTINIVGFARLPTSFSQKVKLNNLPLSSLLYKYKSLGKLTANLTSNILVEHINIDFAVGDTLLLNFHTEDGNLVVNGVIEALLEETDSIVVIPNDSKKKLTITLDDPTVDIINTTLSSRSKLTDDVDKLKIFLFGQNGDTQLDNIRLKKYVSSVVVSTNNVLEKIKAQSEYEEFNINHIISTLNTFNLSLDDFTVSQLTSFIKILRNNMKKQLDNSDAKTRSYNKFIKNPPPPEKKQIYTISDKSLKSVAHLYGEYPYYNKGIDSIETRLRWIYSKVDHGEYYFRSIVKNIIDKFNFKPGEIIEKIEAKKTKLEADLFAVNSNVERMKTELVKSDNQCPNNRIVKVYKSYKSLEKDNDISGIEIDKDARLFGEREFDVKPGMYCILDVDGIKKLFKRVVLDGGKEIWSLETTINVDHLVNENKDFCETQNKKINELESDMFLDVNACSFNDLENRCIPKFLDLEISKKYDLENRLKELGENIESLKSDETKESIGDSLKKIQLYIEAHNKLAQSKYENVEKDIMDEKRDEVEPEHEMLYKKIDLYIEKISKLENAERYQLLEVLMQKYGRDYIPSNEPKENSFSVYCKYGNKVICCECDKRMIQLYKDTSNFDEELKILLDDLGVEEDGMNWCKNCGREIHIAEGETTENFKKNGARDVSHEMLDAEDQPNKESNRELFENLKMFLNAEDGGISTDNKLDIMKIYKAILEVMGISLKESDELNILKTVSGICATNIKNKYEWSSSYKGKSKSIDKAYLAYTSINTIIYTASYLFIMLQSSVPEYSITKPHIKCAPSLEGYPLIMDDENMKGLMYLKCILESYADTNQDWKGLKKIKLDTTLKSTISKLASDDYIQFRYKEKRHYIENKSVKFEKIEPLNTWNEFRPPLKVYDIDNSSVDNIGVRELKGLRGYDLTNAKHYLALKTISEIDKSIGKEDVSNYLFTPAVLGNSCCLQQITPEYDYMTMFKTSSTFTGIETKLNIINAIQNSDKKNTIYKTYTDEFTKLPSFRNNVFPAKEDISNEEIRLLFETYVPNGEFKGQRRIYYNNTCILTNRKRKDILDKEYTFEHYIELIKIIHGFNLNLTNEYRIKNKLDNGEPKLSSQEESTAVTNMMLSTTKATNSKSKSKSKSNTLSVADKRVINIDTDINGELSILKNVMIILSKNEVTLKNTYISKFFERLKSEKDAEAVVELWKDFKLQIGVEIDEIEEYVEELVSKSVAINLGNQLKQLGELRTIFKDNEDSLGYDSAKNISVNAKIRHINRYLYTYLFGIPQKIKNDMGIVVVDKKDKPPNWNISQNYINKLNDILKSNSHLCEEFILDKRSNNNQIVYDSLCSLIKRNNRELSHLCAKEHELSCDGIIKIFSKCTNRNLASVLHMVFVLIFKEMLQSDLITSESIQRNMLTKPSTLSDDNSGDLQDDGGDSGDIAKMVLEEMNTLEGPEDMVDNSAGRGKGKSSIIVTDTEPTHRLLVCRLLVEISNEIEKDRVFLDKHSKTDISENIEKKLEADKEDNLAIMKDLDRESRQSLTNMIKLGMATWKNLSKKEDINLYFGETIEEVDNMDPGNGENDNQPVIYEEDETENILSRAQQDLGDNYTSEQLDEWNERRANNDRTDREAATDMDVMPDEDFGDDDYGGDAGGDDAYY